MKDKKVEIYIYGVLVNDYDELSYEIWKSMDGEGYIGDDPENTWEFQNSIENDIQILIDGSDEHDYTWRDLEEITGWQF